ncbi:HEPN domain-containing protein [Synechococcus sp. BDU 130192]|uniref:HEPN domain-containing protein n=1 Tax=Synechococcus sp. BDU 130192 TaxID=2042059 RepID=UPI000C07DEAC|nr:HEPN domain-containing protein [Synechococcus sp. BDU 130192]
MISKSQAVLNHFASRSLRDTADKDYIASRAAYRMQLDQQFLWLGLQSIEKYFKAILLFNGQSAKTGHDLNKALNRINKMEDFKISLPEDSLEFIDYINNYGPNRYLDYPSYIPLESLLMLDKTIWYVRRYCYYMRGISNEIEVNQLNLELNRVESKYFKDRPNKLIINDGFLEKSIKNKLPSRKALIWKNFYFGQYHKKTIRNSFWRESFTNPTPFIHDDYYKILKEYVQFPPPVHEHFSE